jgi:hypothetical protein
MAPPTFESMRRVQAFYENAMPGMTLKQAPRPLQKRCADGCGRPISQKRKRCMECQQVFLKDLASEVGDQDLLDAVISRCEPDVREEVYDGLKPHLSFTPAPFARA